MNISRVRTRINTTEDTYTNDENTPRTLITTILTSGKLQKSSVQLEIKSPLNMNAIKNNDDLK